MLGFPILYFKGMRLLMFQPSGFYYCISALLFGSFRKLGVRYHGVLIIRSLLSRVLYQGPLFSETPICLNGSVCLQCDPSNRLWLLIERQIDIQGLGQFQLGGKVCRFRGSGLGGGGSALGRRGAASSDSRRHVLAEDVILRSGFGTLGSHVWRG